MKHEAYIGTIMPQPGAPIEVFLYRGPGTSSYFSMGSAVDKEKPSIFIAYDPEWPEVASSSLHEIFEYCMMLSQCGYDPSIASMPA